MKQSPIFTRTYDLLRWSIPLTVKFPRQQRFVLAGAVQQAALDFQGSIIEAAHQRRPQEGLIQADAELDKLRARLRLCRDLSLRYRAQRLGRSRLVIPQLTLQLLENIIAP